MKYTIVYKGIEIRQYNDLGQILYCDICFTDDLEVRKGKPILHDSIDDARDYIDAHVAS